MDAAAPPGAAEEDDGQPAVALIDDEEQQHEEGGGDGGLGRRSRRSKRRRREAQRPSLAPEEQTLRIRVSELACVVGLHPFQCIVEAVMNHVYQGASMLSHVTSPDKTKRRRRTRPPTGIVLTTRPTLLAYIHTSYS